MTNKKKNSTPKNKNVEIKEEQFIPTEEQIYDFLKFAGSLYNGVYTPDLVHQRMQQITMNQIPVSTVEKVTEALSDPQNNEQVLIGYSEYMELISMLYKRILLYFSGLMAFNFEYTAINVKNEKEYKSQKYKDDLRIVEEFFDKFDHKNEFRIAIKQMLRQEVFYAIFRDDGIKFNLQELPQSYCKITGRWDYGLVYDFNMNFFLQAGADLNMFPPVFKKLFKKTFENPDIHYRPSLPMDRRGDNWAYWIQTSPKDGFVALKFSPEIATVVPFLAPLLGDVVLQPIVRALQTNSYIQEATKILFGQVEFIKDASSKVKDALTLNPETLGKFLQLMKSGLPDAIKVAAAPLANTAAVEFKGNEKMYDSYLKSTSSISGINSRLIYSFDRQNVLETKLSMDIDQNILRPAYNQMANLLSYWINQRTKKYKFQIVLSGFNTSLDREERLETSLKMADSGMVLDQKFANALDMSIFHFRRQLAETKANGFVERLTPILKSNQMSKEKSKDSGGGRPEKKDEDLTESGSESKEVGSNEEKGYE